jgi:SAM-dependent methyltransferase
MPDAAQLNQEQLEYWGGAGGARWIAQQHRRDAMLGDLGHAALVAADAQPGETVLDIGCGCGETTAILAQSVGPAGRVTAVDVSAQLLEQARQRLQGMPHARTVLADAASHDFAEADTDLIFSRFGVMFFGDPRQAFTNIRKAAKPSGRLVFACWRTPQENRWMSAPAEAIAKHFPAAEKPDLALPGPFAFCNPERVAGILTAAGFSPPEFTKVDKMMDLAHGEGLEGAVRSAMELGPAARLLDGEGDDMRDRVADTLRAFFAPKILAGRLELPAAVWIVAASPS